MKTYENIRKYMKIYAKYTKIYAKYLKVYEYINI